MGRRNKGFNTPFAKLDLPAKPASSAKPPQPTPPPRDEEEENEEEVDETLVFARAMAGVTPHDHGKDRILKVYTSTEKGSEDAERS